MSNKNEMKNRFLQIFSRIEKIEDFIGINHKRSVNQDFHPTTEACFNYELKSLWFGILRIGRLRTDKFSIDFKCNEKLIKLAEELLSCYTNK